MNWIFIAALYMIYTSIGVVSLVVIKSENAVQTMFLIILWPFVLVCRAMFSITKILTRIR